MTRYLCFFFLLGIGTPILAQKIYLPIKVKHQWTFLEVTDKTTHLDTTRLYDNLGDINLPWFGKPGTKSGYYQVEQNGQLGLVTTSFEPILKPAWHEIHPLSDQYFLVAKNGSYHIIDKDGKPVLKGDDYQAIKLKEDNSLAVFMIKQQGKWGVRKSGQKNWSIPPDYVELEFLNTGKEGFFKVKDKKENGDKWQIIDWTATNLPGLEGAFERIEVASRNHVAIQEVGRKSPWSIRDLSGKELLVLDPETDVKMLNQHLLGYREKGSRTYSVLVMRKEVTPLVEKFHYLQKINENLVFYRIGKKAGFIESNGNLIEIETEQRIEILADEDDLIRVKGKIENEQNRKWGLYSIKEHRFIHSCKYDSIAPFQGSFAQVLQTGKIGLLNKEGDLIISIRYDEIPYLESGINEIYCYWKDSVAIYPVDQNGTLSGEPYMEKSSAILGPSRYYWMDYGAKYEKANFNIEEAVFSATPNKKKDYWQDLVQKNQQDTIWVEKGQSYWQFMAGHFQLIQQEEVEVKVREKSASAKKKKKKKRKKATSTSPKKTILVKKWRKKGRAFKYLRKATTVNWTLGYHDNGGLVSNELTNKGRTRRSARKISVFLNENNSLLPDFEMLGIRLSDFEEGQIYAAFVDLDGKIGLIDQKGNQALDLQGVPLRFTYISKAAEGKMQACHESSAFYQLGKSKAQLFQEFGVVLVNSAGNQTSELKSTGKPRWGYIDLNGATIIPFEYELTAPFKDNFAINKQNGKWGAINSDNEVIIPFEYDDLILENDKWKVVKQNDSTQEFFYDEKGRRFDNKKHARQAIEGHYLFRVKKKEGPSKYGYVNEEGELIIPHQFDEASEFIDGLATVRKKRKWFFINESGEEAISIDSNLIGIIEVGNFNEGFCPIRKTTIHNKKSTRKYGYLNAKGEMAIPPTFDGASMFEGGVAIVDSLNFAEYKSSQGGGVPKDRGLIDKSGNLITGYEFRRISSFNEAGFAEVIHSKNRKHGVVGKNGEVLTGNYYEKVKSFKDGMAGLDGAYWKVFDYSGNEIPLEVPQVSRVGYFSDGNLFVKNKSNLWCHLEMVNNQAVIKQSDFQSLQAFENGYAYARINKQTRLYGADQNWIYPGKGQSFKFWSDNLIGIKTRTTEYYANLGLQNPFGRTFDAINKFSDKISLVNYQGKFGIINRNGLFIVPPKFNTISIEKEGPIKVQLPSQLYGLRSKNGKEIVPAKYDTIRHLRNGIIQVEFADFVGYYRANGEPLWVLD